jgi:hypothetical protein
LTDGKSQIRILQSQKSFGHRRTRVSAARPNFANDILQREDVRRRGKINRIGSQAPELRIRILEVDQEEAVPDRDRTVSGEKAGVDVGQLDQERLQALQGRIVVVGMRAGIRRMAV